MGFTLHNASPGRYRARAMRKTLLKITPVAMLALAACSNSETPAEGEAAEGEEAAEVAEPVEMPAPIVKDDVYRCADSTVIYVDFFGRDGADGPKTAAAIRAGDKLAEAIRLEAPKPEAEIEGEGEDGASDAEAVAPEGPMVSADGEATLSGDGAAIQVKLPNKNVQTCKA